MCIGDIVNIKIFIPSLNVRCVGVVVFELCASGADPVWRWGAGRGTCPLPPNLHQKLSIQDWSLYFGWTCSGGVLA